ncbi:MAG TPA: GAF and ANTAR domain-containing protein [Pilimelia sp.]|nr:GAF and ANTAR domain-containing protein [Pilimelia sp.]
MASVREQRLAETFVELADTLVADFDVVEFLHVLSKRCVELLDVEAAGLMLADQRGSLQVVAASTERTRLLELFEVQTDAGPCVACYEAGNAVTDLALDPAGPRWPRFAAAAREAGFRAVHALPMRLRDDVIGVLNLFRAEPLALTDEDLRVAQALADVATIGLLQERAIRRTEVLAEQLQGALNSRIIIEQAKGVLAERLGADVGEAFRALRGYARRHNLRLAELAAAVIAGELDAADIRVPADANRAGESS